MTRKHKPFISVSQIDLVKVTGNHGVLDTVGEVVEGINGSYLAVEVNFVRKHKKKLEDRF